MEFNYNIAKSVGTSNRPVNPAVAKLVALVSGAPFPLSVGQVIAVAEDAGIELPTAVTVRAWLQAAAERGELTRPTIRVYSGPVSIEDGNPEPETAAPVEQETAPVEDADDPLADILNT